MDIRPARPTDANDISRVQAEASEAAYSGMLADEHLQECFLNVDTDALEGRLEWIGSDDDVVYLVAERGRTILGFAQFVCGDHAPERLGPDVAFLRSLYVRPANWREGIGKELLSEGVSRIPERIDRVELAVFTRNDVGRGFYEKQGFEQTGEGSFEIDGTPYDTRIYARSLEV